MRSSDLVGTSTVIDIEARGIPNNNWQEAKLILETLETGRISNIFIDN